MIDSKIILQKTFIFTTFIKFCICAVLSKKSNKNLEYKSSLSPEYKNVVLKYYDDAIELEFLQDHAPRTSNNKFSNSINLGNESIDDIIKTKENDTSAKPIHPRCERGDGNCTKCKEISVFCHYMYSEKRCVYYYARHGSNLYECGRRWFPVDRNEEFIAALVVLLIFTFISTCYMIWLRLRLTLPEYIDVVDDQQLAEMRNVVQMIREKYQ